MSWAINDILCTGWWYKQSCERQEYNHKLYPTSNISTTYVNNFADKLTPVFSSLKRSPSMLTWTAIRCLCSPAARIAIFRSAKAAWHIRSPRASDTSRIPISFALNDTPSPRKRVGSFLTEKKNILWIFYEKIYIIYYSKDQVFHDWKNEWN